MSTSPPTNELQIDGGVESPRGGSRYSRFSFKPTCSASRNSSHLWTTISPRTTMHGGSDKEGGSYAEIPIASDRRRASTYDTHVSRGSIPSGSKAYIQPRNIIAQPIDAVYDVSLPGHTYRFPSASAVSGVLSERTTNCVCVVCGDSLIWPPRRHERNRSPRRQSGTRTRKPWPRLTTKRLSERCSEMWPRGREYTHNA